MTDESSTRAEDGPLNRRAALGVAGVATASAALMVSACAIYTPTGTVGGTASGGEAAAPAQDPASLGPASSVPVGGGRVFTDQEVVVTQPVAGQFKAFSAVCTHLGCTVSTVADGTINCPCHGSKYKITDGSVAHGPAELPLQARQVSVDGGNLRVG